MHVAMTKMHLKKKLIITVKNQGKPTLLYITRLKTKGLSICINVTLYFRTRIDCMGKADETRRPRVMMKTTAALVIPLTTRTCWHHTSSSFASLSGCFRERASIPLPRGIITIVTPLQQPRGNGDTMTTTPVKCYSPSCYKA